MMDREAQQRRCTKDSGDQRLASCTVPAPPGLEKFGPDRFSGNPRCGYASEYRGSPLISACSTSLSDKEFSSPDISDIDEASDSKSMQSEHVSKKPTSLAISLFAALALDDLSQTAASPPAVAGSFSALALEPPNFSAQAELAPAAVAVPTPAALMQGGTAESWAPKDAVGLWYSEKSANDKALQRLVFLAGVRVKFMPQIDVSAEQWRALATTVTFAADPPLPQGLSVHPATGVISGVVTQARGQASLHKIIVYVPGTRCGISLGALPLTSCTVDVHIIDPEHFALSSREDDVNQLSFKLQPN